MNLAFSLLLLPMAVLNADDFGWLHLSENRDPVEITPKSRHPVLKKWIEQKLDHFNPHDNRTWKMRYFANDEHFKPGGAMVIYIGGEWQISAGNLLGGQGYDIAKQNSAYMFYPEHRYYGKSHPTPDASTMNLQYLSVDQALADLAYFVKHIKHTDPDLESSKVLVIGASYAAMLATWFRLKYPHLVDVALASSAPLLAVADFYQFFEVVGRSLVSKGGQACYKRIENGMQQLREKISAPDGANFVAKLFNLCTPVEPENTLDLATLECDLSTKFALVVQNHKDGDIENLCSFLQKQLTGGNTELHAIAAFAKRSWGTECYDASYLNKVRKHKDPVWGNNSTLESMRQWFYQTCTEFGFYQTDSSKSQPFGNGEFIMHYWYNLCKDVFDKESIDNARQILDAGVKRTNTLYGGLTPAVTRVIFTHGTIDPWHALGILHDLNEQAPAIVIPGAAHCKDLRSLSTKDSTEMWTAKLRVQQLISEWLAVDTDRDLCAAEDPISRKSRPNKRFHNRHRNRNSAKNREL